MGLGQDQNNASLAILRRISHWRLPAVLIISSGIIELFGDSGRSFLQFDRAAISAGELWRLISGHFVHLGPNHFFLNAFGLVLVWFLVGMRFRLRQWLIVIAVSIAGIDAGLWFFDAQLTWYVGMSGFLHGMLAAGIVKGFPAVPREAMLIGVVVVVKIMFEQLVGPLPGSEQSAGGDVVVNAHLYGVLAGVATAAVFWNRDMAKSPI